MTQLLESGFVEQVDQSQSEQQRDSFINRVLQSAAGVFDTFTIYLGNRLGYYDALAQHGPLTSVDLAQRTGTHERYTREWLEQQTVTGTLSVENPEDAPQHRRFWLPAGHAEVLVERENLNYLAPLVQLLVGAVHPLEAIVDVYRNGGGILFEDYGKDLREGQAGVNRNMFLYELGQHHLPSIPDIHARLQQDLPARIADIGCGAGWSSIGMALAYPNVRVDGFDLDAASVALARQNVEAYGLSDRVQIQHRDASDLDLVGQYDLVTAFEAVHDMSDPVNVLSSMRYLANATGSVLVVDERVGDTFTPEGNDVEWIMYGWSVLHCLPVGMVEHPAAGTGTVMRADTLRRYALSAGFSDVEILPIDNFFFRYYQLHV
jgi:2-polyprenyl-3-methyl-5-hydroxy-6-metoxy-1,4-benzoquinol methylase